MFTVVRPLYKKVVLFILYKELKDESNNGKIGIKKSTKKATFVLWEILYDNHNVKVVQINF